MPNRIHYNKLIRDLIPGKIEAKGSECATRELSPEEFRKELRRKVGEEASALPSCETKEELIDELADVIAVLDELQKAEGITDEELADAIAENLETKGGFEKRIFLEWSSDDGYTTNETTS
ncbi:MAG: hypothetical protein AB199_01940 [Parcubacteria bacterium C7867-004]|nr:MAG: hypothetical protein AB199_01940 [Parcubacteria bacterium C7867-004]